MTDPAVTFFVGVFVGFALGVFPLVRGRRPQDDRLAKFAAEHLDHDDLCNCEECR